ncbi:MAG: DUF4013 domain-containing protein [bacterium]
MKLDYTKAFKGLFTNTELKSSFLITTILTFICLTCFTIIETKKPDIPAGMMISTVLILIITGIINLGYSIEIINNEINNTLNSLPSYKNQVKTYFVNGLKYLLVILLIMIAVIIDCQFFSLASILLGSILALLLICLPHVSHPMLIILIILFILFLIFQVISAQFAKNFSISEGLRPIKAIKFLFKNLADYLKVSVILIVLALALFIANKLILTILSIIVTSLCITGTKSPIFTIIIGSIDSLGITPLALYINIVVMSLYAQIYRLGNEQKTEIISE